MFPYSLYVDERAPVVIADLKDTPNPVSASIKSARCLYRFTMQVCVLRVC